MEIQYVQIDKWDFDFVKSSKHCTANNTTTFLSTGLREQNLLMYRLHIINVFKISMSEIRHSTVQTKALRGEVQV